MANKKKPTIMQIQEQLNMAVTQINFLSRMLDSVGVAFSNYVRFNDDEDLSLIHI